MGIMAINPTSTSHSPILVGFIIRLHPVHTCEHGLSAEEKERRRGEFFGMSARRGTVAAFKSAERRHIRWQLFW
jgi:hypothetical protein